jgi:hypothetical protein
METSTISIKIPFGENTKRGKCHKMEGWKARSKMYFNREEGYILYNLRVSLKYIPIFLPK